MVYRGLEADLGLISRQSSEEGLRSSIHQAPQLGVTWAFAENWTLSSFLTLYAQNLSLSPQGYAVPSVPSNLYGVQYLSFIVSPEIGFRWPLGRGGLALFGGPGFQLSLALGGPYSEDSSPSSIQEEFLYWKTGLWYQIPLCEVFHFNLRVGVGLPLHNLWRGGPFSNGLLTGVHLGISYYPGLKEAVGTP